MMTWKLFVVALILSVMTSCGGGGGGASNGSTTNISGAVTTQLPLLSNEMQINVEQWQSSSISNQGFVSITICIPQTTNCQTIDHVLVDTGSFGLRVMKAALNLSLVQNNLNGNPLAECAQFVSGYTWGPVANADINLGSQTAGNVPIQVIDPSYGSIPVSCSSSGTSMNNASALGANGILGIGSFQEDCELCTIQAVSGHYYVCSPSCTPTAVAQTAQVSNPVVFLSSNNNGVVIDLPSANTTGQINLAGKLIFGIDTTTNNTISTQTVFLLDSNGYLATNYNTVNSSNASISAQYRQSYLDTGSNGIYFPRDYSIPMCHYSSGFYCPVSEITKTATISSGSSSTSVQFSIGNADSQNSSNGVQPDLVGVSSGSSVFDWGLPFFYGRKVFVSISGQLAHGSSTPFVAF